VSTDSVEDVRPVVAEATAQADAQALGGSTDVALYDTDTDTVTVAALCEKFGTVCESAVDPLEVASALEFDGFGDRAVKDGYGVDDVFALARAMYLRVPRQPAAPAPAEDPWRVNRLRPLLHGLLYALPAVCFPAAAGLLGGPGVLPTLVTALLVAWGLSQGLACIGYLRRSGTADEDQVRRVLRAGLGAGLVLVAAAMLGAWLNMHTDSLVLFFGAGEGVYMLGASVVMVVGKETWLPVALAPGVVGSAVFLYLGRPPQLEHPTWAALGATPLAACLIALVVTRKTRKKGSRTGRLVLAHELRAAVPAIAFGLIAAGLLTFPVVAGPEGRGGLNAGALLASLPLSLSMGAAEWSLLWYRRRTRRLLATTSRLRRFRLRARLSLLATLLQYACGTAALIAAGVAISAATGFAHPQRSDLPEIAAYLMLGSAMFLALMLQTMRIRAVPLAAVAAGLAAELIFRHTGMFVQVVTPAALLVVIGCFAMVSLGSAVRHG
jgi:hypothetical protein